MTPARVVVRGPNWLGDLVMAAPAIDAVSAAWPDAVVDVAVPAAFAPIVAVLCPKARGLALEGGRGWRTLARHAAQVRDGRYDLALLLTNSFGTALVMTRAGVPERWGYRRDARRWLLTRAVPQRSTRRVSRHHADYYAALVDALGLPRPAPHVQARIPDAVRIDVAELLRREGWDETKALLTCAPGAAYGTAKQWPPEMVADVAKAWITGGGAVALGGAAADRPAAAIVTGHVRRQLGGVALPIFDLTGCTTLLQLAGVLAASSRVLANDSGAMHLAAAVGTPVVSVFGPTDARATMPLGRHVILTHEVWCRPCLLRECPLDHRCMTGVAPSRVIAALAQDA